MQTETPRSDRQIFDNFSVKRVAGVIERHLKDEPYVTLAVASGLGFVLGRGVRHYLLGAASRFVVSWMVGPLMDELKSAVEPNE
jgi:hypothetical protein